MQKVNVREARQHIGRILDAVANGEEYVVMRRDKPVAKLSAINHDEISPLRFPDRHDFRTKLPTSRIAGHKLIREMRDERG